MSNQGHEQIISKIISDKSSTAKTNEQFKDEKINEHKNNILKLLGKAILEQMRKSQEKKSTVGEIKEKLQSAIVK